MRMHKTKMIKNIISMCTNNDDIILDFFGGSGTTAHSILELNKNSKDKRKFILVQLPEPTDESSEAYKAGYKTSADICKERIRRVIKKLQITNDKGKKCIWLWFIVWLNKKGCQI